MRVPNLFRKDQGLAGAGPSGRKSLRLSVGGVPVINFRSFLAAAGIMCCVAGGLLADDAGLDFFESKVRPALVEHCYKCHSAGAEKLKGGLLLDSREGVLKGGDSGPAVVPGKPDESLLVKAVRRLDKDLAMPPKKELPEAV